MVKQAVVLLFFAGQIFYSFSAMVNINDRPSEDGGEYCARKIPQIFSQAK